VSNRHTHTDMVVYADLRQVVSSEQTLNVYLYVSIIMCMVCGKLCEGDVNFHKNKWIYIVLYNIYF